MESDLISKYAAEARARKVATYVALFQVGGLSSEMVARMSLTQWAVLAQGAGLRLPSEETRRQVIEAMGTKERMLKHGHL